MMAWPSPRPAQYYGNDAMEDDDGIPVPPTWRTHSPSGSLTSIIRAHPHVRLYVYPLLWTPRQPELLQVKVEVMLDEIALNSTPAHRPTCPRCHRCGRVPSTALNLLQSHPYRTEKDRNLARLIRSTTGSLRTLSGATLFKISRQCALPLFFAGRRQCWIVQPLLVQDVSAGTPLLAFTHESGRCDAFDDRFPRTAATRKAKARLIETRTMVSEINPHDVAVLIAMAQEAQRVESKTKSNSKSQGQRAALFTASTRVSSS
jgi:hypothetical protein